MKSEGALVFVGYHYSWKTYPKIYMRQDVNPVARRATREIVDGQQRLHSVLNFLEDGFPILRDRNEEHGGMRFSQLDEETQLNILKYEFSVDLLQDMPDQVYDVFARLNTYSVTLDEGLRNAQYFGEFKTTAYALANEFMTFWQTNGIFSDAKILHMAEAELVSGLLIAMATGIRERSKGLIDGFYRDNDERLRRRDTLTKRFRDSMDAIGGIMGDTLAASTLASRNFSTHCSVPSITCFWAARVRMQTTTVHASGLFQVADCTRCGGRHLRQVGDGS